MNTLYTNEVKVFFRGELQQEKMISNLVKLFSFVD